MQNSFWFLKYITIYSKWNFGDDILVLKGDTKLPAFVSLCEVTDSNVNDDNSNANGLHQVDSSYGHFRCITHNCKSCGPDQVPLEILQNNERIEDDKTMVEWQHQDWVEKKGSKLK